MPSGAFGLAVAHAAAFVFVVIAAAAWRRVVVNRGFADVYGGAGRSVYGYGFVDGGLRLHRQVDFGIAPEWGFAVCASGEDEGEGKNAPVHLRGMGSRE